MSACRAPGFSPCTVYLRAGTYYQSETVALGVQDSGLTIAGAAGCGCGGWLLVAVVFGMCVTARGSPVTVAAYNGEEAWVSGGIPITPTWKPYNVSSVTWVVEQSENAVSGASGHGALNTTSWELVSVMC